MSKHYQPSGNLSVASSRSHVPPGSWLALLNSEELSTGRFPHSSPMQSAPLGVVTRGLQKKRHMRWPLCSKCAPII
jgi:hypothetical protein